MATLKSDAILSEAAPAAAAGGWRRAVDRVEDGVFTAASVALVAASLVTTIGVAVRHLAGIALEWQDEVTIYLVLGAVFLAAAAVQRRRGHIGIEAAASLLGPRGEARRQLLTDAVALGFTLFFAWKSWTLMREAWDEGQTSASTWGPPLWVPYGLMSLGMTLLVGRLALQVGERSRALLGLVAAAAVGFYLWDQPFGPLIQGLPVATVGIAYCIATLAAMASGLPIAFALGSVATLFMLALMPKPSLDVVAQNVFEELANVIILAIPLFILKGAAIGKSDAGRELYAAVHAWLHRVPGGLGIANTVACGLFAAMAGSSPATCSAIGSAGIPEMRARGYPGGFAAGIIAAGGTLGILLPPSVTMLLYAVAAEVSLGRLFIAGIGPGLLLILLFAGYTALRFRREHGAALARAARTGERSAILDAEHLPLGARLRLLTRVAPFVIILAGVMVVLYAGYASPSETAGVGAVLALAVIGLMYRVWQPARILPILTGTLRESSMLLMIVGMSLLYSYVMSYLHISQSAAEWITGIGLSRWLLLACVLLFVVVLGFFLPPVSIILMTAPIVLPALKAAGFDLIWFGVVMTVVMEMGLIHPPVGLNLFVIRMIAPDVPLKDVMWGALPFVGLMVLAVLALCLMPGIALWLPSRVF